ncbi:hypothetical protein AB0D35_15340 [Streptomyces sp. NPDC048301]|uniref:hypothetical protein n=1 Tax=Streptomyces sp. NPDC048301 TaxID=3155631 RepID=UPI00342730B7
MSEPKQPEQSTEVPPELTPAEQREQDQERVTGQIVVTDVTRQMQAVMETFGFGGSGSSGRTSFEGHELNAMIDLIENSSPEHLEEAGQALLKARTSLNDAAKELGDFIGAVDWEGESGSAFRDWGNGLVAHAYKLGEYAQTAGTQITVAGTGLASVRSSLPPRDTRLVRKSPEDIESPARIEGNPEYAAAVKVEKDRQEAINQANRLASYYAVSEETLAAQEPPRFDKKLDVAMPRPSGWGDGSDTNSATSGASSLPTGTRPESVTGHSTVDNSGTAVRDDGFASPVIVTPVPDRTTSTEINSVAVAQTPPASPAVATQPTPTGPTGAGSPPAPVPPGFTNPVNNGIRASQGPAGAPKAVGQGGNWAARGTGTGGATASGRSVPTVGRPSPMSGTGPASSSAGRVSGGSSSPMAGRSGVTGGRPVVGGRANAAGTAGPRGGRASGIMGGTPQRAVPSSSGGARSVPRGTVVGAGGANSATPRPSGRSAPNTSGVVGAPRGGAQRPGATGKGFTTGGAGLVRGPAARRNSDQESQDEVTSRPDYLTEDPETWEAGRRGTTPPVIE